ncbi:restriction endonuclease subunit S [Enterococcus faecium]|uniref:restriction endonuclease subunit S n=1 Tax=Enterococcus faecium TaxID=1352 RepID=UPI00338D4FB9
MSNDTQPEIRFPGFTEDWEQRKFKEIINERREKTKVENEDILLSSAIKGMFLNSELFSHFRGSSNIGYLKIKKNDLILSAQNLHLGNCNVNLRFDSGIVSPAYKVYELVNAEPNYINSWLKRDTTKNFFLKATTEGASVCRKNIEWETLYSQKLYIPKIEEQIKIGNFFKQLDETIALHQRKLDLLKETKKGFLQKMFPKNGAKVPEIRFPGFTGDWEERKFGEIVQVSRGLTYKPSDVQIDGIRVLRSSNINEDVFILRDDDVFVKPDAVNIAPIKNGDILITSANGSSRLVGKHAIVNGLQDKTVHGGFMLRVKSKNTWFTNSLMSSRWYNYFINIYVSGGNGAIGNLRKYDLESQTIIVPDDEEQQKIGAFFKQLDDTIALHQHELDLLKETKKGFLQKMFV